jgi:hypothetical protein
MVAGNDETKSRPLPTREMRQSLCVCVSMTAAIEPSFLIYRRCTAVCGPLEGARKFTISNHGF